MLFPSVFGENLFDDWSGFPVFRGFGDIDRKLYGKNAPHMMKTDVHDNDDHFEIVMDLPGFKKDQITLKLEGGYMTVGAAKGLDKDENDKQGRLIRQERYAGAMQRSFYVGEYVTEADIRARFEDGVLHITVPKKEPPKEPQQKLIAIEG